MEKEGRATGLGGLRTKVFAKSLDAWFVHKRSRRRTLRWAPYRVSRRMRTGVFVLELQRARRLVSVEALA